MSSLPPSFQFRFAQASERAHQHLPWQYAVECSGLGLWQFNVQTGETICSARWLGMLGLPLDHQATEFLNRLDFIHPEDRPQALADLALHIEGATDTYTNEHRVRHADGHYFWVLSRGRVISRDPWGKPEWMVGTYSDIDRRKRAEAATAAAERTFRTTFEDAPIGMALVSPAGSFLDVNAALCRILGYPHDELLRCSFQDITHPDDLEADLSLVGEMLANQRLRYRMEKRYRHRSGRIVYAQLDVSLVRNDAGEPDYFLSQIQDITEQRAMERQLAEEKELAQITLGAIGDGVIRTNAQGEVTFCNAAAGVLLGVSATSALGQRFDRAVALRSERDLSPVPSPVEHVLASGLPTGAPTLTLLCRADGQMIAVEDSAAPIRNEEGELIGCVFVFHDVSQTRALANELHYQAHHDPLTGLPNRREFEVALATKMASAASRRAVHTLLYLDLDRFKLINDTCGHAAGDTVLCAVSTLMRKRLRASDLLARLGGDEFAVILDNCDADRARPMAETLVKAVESYRFTFEGRTYQLGLSIGLAVIDDRVENVNVLLSQADTACYIAKRRGRSRVQRYERDDAEVTRTMGEMHWINRLDAAIAEGRLEVYAQRICQATTRTAAGYETLMRLRERDGAILSPGPFLAAARRFGLTTRLDRWMVSRVHALLERTSAAFTGYLTVNVSGLSLSDEDFADFLLATLDAQQVPPERLRFEITETDAFTSSTTAAALVNQLRLRGHKVLLDDFGSGFLSFEQLRSLSADGLKIDQAYTRALASDPLNRTIIESICRISRQLGLEVIAEGVEDEASLAVLIELGVERVQGYLFHKAEPILGLIAPAQEPALPASLNALG